MRISELMAFLETLKSQHGDLEVIGQTAGCCPFGHDIKSIAMGVDRSPAGFNTAHEIGQVVMRLE